MHSWTFCRWDVILVSIPRSGDRMEGTHNDHPVVRSGSPLRKPDISTGGVRRVLQKTRELFEFRPQKSTKCFVCIALDMQEAVSEFNGEIADRW